VVAVLRHVVFIIEFKVGEKSFASSARDQVWDYALDLKNFHQTSHDKVIAPILVATLAPTVAVTIATTVHADGLLQPICVNAAGLGQAFSRALEFCDGSPINTEEWNQGRYSPTPTIIEAAMALYGNHSVSEISRTDASAINLTRTSEAVSEIIRT